MSQWFAFGVSSVQELHRPNLGQCPSRSPEEFVSFSFAAEALSFHSVPLPLDTTYAVDSRLREKKKDSLA